MGGIAYTRDVDGFVQQISSTDGTLTVTNPAAPTEIDWTGSVSGSVTIGRNSLFQATSIGANGHLANVTVDPDGVVTQAGGLSIGRDAAGSAISSTLGTVSDTTDRKPFGEPTRDAATVPPGVGGWATGELFTEEYARDGGGRITGQTVRIRNPESGDVETYRIDYTYDAADRLGTVQYNNGPVITYGYDANNNLSN